MHTAVRTLNHVRAIRESNPRKALRVLDGLLQHFPKLPAAHDIWCDLLYPHSPDTLAILPPITIGVNLVPFSNPEQLSRQQHAIDAINTLTEDDVPLHPLNLCFPDEVLDCGWPTSPCLQRNSRDTLGIEGRRLPLVRDLFSLTAKEARKRGHEWFAVMNSDIILTPALFTHLASILCGPFETIPVARNEISQWNGLSSPLPELWSIPDSSLDLFFCRTDWWEANESRFQDYILGESCWDWTYASIMACHSFTHFANNHDGLTLHLSHGKRWGSSTHTNFYLELLQRGHDFPYASRWYQYSLFFLQSMRSGQHPDDRENQSLIKTVFTTPAPEEAEAARLAHERLRPILLPQP